jgi:DNA excision repair protein ERCC-1
MSDDEYGGSLPDAALAAALDAAERPRAPPPAPAAPPPRQPRASNPSAPPQPPNQPTPQRVSRGAASSILVSPRQKGNPLLLHIKNVAWEYGPPTLTCDYLLSPSTISLFLSLKYHKLHPDYIYARLRALGTAYDLRILLVLVDITEHSDPIRQLTKASLVGNFTMLLAWSTPEAGRYLETFKAYEHAQPTSIMEKVSEEYGDRLVEVVTQVRSVNKTDAVTLVSTFGSVRAAVNAAPEEVMMISGWGQQKVQRWERAVREPFRVRKSAAAASAERRGVGVRKTGQPADVAARLGIRLASLARERIGAGEHNTVASSTSRVPEEWVMDDEDALAAVAEMEAAERASREGKGITVGSARPDAEKGKKRERDRAGEVPPEVGNSIMEALSKMRERN